VEALSKIDTIVLDKTGTLTESRQETIEFSGDVLTHEDQEIIKSLVQHSTHPLSQKIFQALDVHAVHSVDKYEEVSGKGIQGLIEGRNIQLGSAKWLGLQEDASDAEDMKTRVFLSMNDEVRGSFLIANVFRKGLRPLLSGLKQQFDMYLLSGDTEREKAALVNLFGSEQNLLFRQTPENKLDFVSRVQGEGAHVLMVGDGLNDAGALRASEVGIAITDDVSAFSPASDGILTGKNLHLLGSFIKMSKATTTVIVASFVISIIYNVVGVSFAVAGKLSPLVSAILMPASSISVVAFTTFTTSLRARMMKLT
jgi:Cu+-exporting ATPase